MKKVILELDRFDFETKKDLAKLIANFLKLQIAGVNPLVEYIFSFHEQYLELVIKKYALKEFTFCSGVLLRAFLGSEKLHKILLDIALLTKLAGFITDATFDVASDTIESFTVITII